MKKIMISLFAIVLIFTVDNVEASSGRLRKDSIKTCNGTMYGKHGGDNHWHVAEYIDGNYYANGDPIYSDPCLTSGGNSDTGGSSSNNFSSNSSSNSGESGSNNSGDNSSANSNGNTSSNSNSNSSVGGGVISNNSGSSSSSVNSKPNSTSVVKSSDNKIKSLIIDNKEINVEDEIKVEVKTTNDSLNLDISLSSDKAKFEVQNNNNFEVGNNEVKIIVTAEDGTTKEYLIYVTRERVLSSDVGVEVIIDDEIVEFDNYSARVYINSDDDSIDFKYTLSSDKATAKVDEIKKFKTGENEMHLIVTAEDGTIQDYTIIVYKYSKAEDIIYGILGFGILGGMGYGIFLLFKKGIPSGKKIISFIRDNLKI